MVWLTFFGADPLFFKKTHTHLLLSGVYEFMSIQEMTESNRAVLFPSSNWCVATVQKGGEVPNDSSVTQHCQSLGKDKPARAHKKGM